MAMIALTDHVFDRPDGRALHDEVYGVGGKRERFRVERVVGYLSFSLIPVGLLRHLVIIDRLLCHYLSTQGAVRPVHIAICETRCIMVFPIPSRPQAQHPNDLEEKDPLINHPHSSLREDSADSNVIVMEPVLFHDQGS